MFWGVVCLCSMYFPFVRPRKGRFRSLRDPHLQKSELAQFTYLDFALTSFGGLIPGKAIFRFVTTKCGHLQFRPTTRLSSAYRRSRPASLARPLYLSRHGCKTAVRG
ncbi:hypothetical protein EI94DRAFT_1725335 [Lactarius quietus]|nr:hypothetical protein EI94DRAFT_1725335 [Lactarius quietus]